MNRMRARLQGRGRLRGLASRSRFVIVRGSCPILARDVRGVRLEGLLPALKDLQRGHREPWTMCACSRYDRRSGLRGFAAMSAFGRRQHAP